jgi:hypothetical protein
MARARPRLKNQMEMIGTITIPMSAPRVAYVNQLQGAPVSASAAQRVADPMIFAIRTAIMPPPAKPTKVEKQPIPTYSHRRVSAGPAFFSTL